MDTEELLVGTVSKESLSKKKSATKRTVFLIVKKSFKCTYKIEKYDGTNSLCCL